MEKRAFKRINVGLGGVILCQDKIYSTFIGNVSEYGLFGLTSITDVSIDFSPGTAVVLQCRIAPDKILDLNCRKIWSSKISPGRLTQRTGMEIINPPTEYKYFINALQEL
jgi:hypothetical protein